MNKLNYVIGKKNNTLTGDCVECGGETSLKIDKSKLTNWQVTGINDHFPVTDNAESFFLCHGICPVCQKRLFEESMTSDD